MLVSKSSLFLCEPEVFFFFRCLDLDRFTKKWDKKQVTQKTRLQRPVKLEWNFVRTWFLERPFATPEGSLLFIVKGIKTGWYNNYNMIFLSYVVIPSLRKFQLIFQHAKLWQVSVLWDDVIIMVSLKKKHFLMYGKTLKKKCYFNRNLILTVKASPRKKLR